MEISDPVTASLEIVAERQGDVTRPIIACYHADCPASAVLMDHMDEHMLGRMVDQVLLLLMPDGDDELDNYIAFETGNHDGYGVQPEMYDNLFNAVLKTIRDIVGDQWTSEIDAAWRARIEHLGAKIKAASDPMPVS